MVIPCGCNSIGRSVDFQSIRCEFESRHPLLCGCNSMVEYLLAEQNIEGSSPFNRYHGDRSTIG